MAQSDFKQNALKTISALLLAAAMPISAGALNGPEGEASSPADTEMHTPQTEWQAAPMPSRADYFAAADLNADGGLTPDEYALFVDTLSDRGEPDMFAVQDSGDYAAGFAAADVNADGLLSYDEISGQPDKTVTETPEDTKSEAQPY